MLRKAVYRLFKRGLRPVRLFHPVVEGPDVEVEKRIVRVELAGSFEESQGRLEPLVLIMEGRQFLPIAGIVWVQSDRPLKQVLADRSLFS